MQWMTICWTHFDIASDCFDKSVRFGHSWRNHHAYMINIVDAQNIEVIEIVRVAHSVYGDNNQFSIWCTLCTIVDAI